MAATPEQLKEYRKKSALSPRVGKHGKRKSTLVWEAMLERELADKFLLSKHKELLNAEIKKTSIKKGEIIEQTEEMDVNAVKSGLDMAYKLKAKYKPIGIKHEISPELQKIIEELNDIIDN